MKYSYPSEIMMFYELGDVDQKVNSKASAASSGNLTKYRFHEVSDQAIREGLNTRQPGELAQMRAYELITETRREPLTLRQLNSLKHQARRRERLDAERATLMQVMYRDHEHDRAQLEHFPITLAHSLSR